MMAGASQRVCPNCNRIISKMRGSLYVCDNPFCHWEGNKTDICYIEFPNANSGECRKPIYQGERS